MDWNLNSGSVFTLSPLPESQDQQEVPHPRLEDYKSRGKETNQTRRRQEFLSLQKEKRRDTTSHARNLPISSEEPPSIELVLNNEVRETSMEGVTKTQPKINFYANKLMIPEILQDVPEDLIGGWLAVPCPSNCRRCLVMTSSGETISRLEDGTIFNRFTSCLPNGSKSRTSQGGHCTLDCLFHEESSTYFVLDMMAWKGNLYYNCATDFRFFWIATKLSEISSSIISSINPFRFIALPFYECDAQGMASAMYTNITGPNEGLLFFNKETHYTPGLTPLVCYLSMDKGISLLQNQKI